MDVIGSKSRSILARWDGVKMFSPRVEKRAMIGRPRCRGLAMVRQSWKQFPVFDVDGRVDDVVVVLIRVLDG